MKLLNLGCGNTYHKDWINIDFVSGNEIIKSHNLVKGIPLRDESVDVVYHSHLLEHFSKIEGKKFIKDCYKVLKMNGIMRIAVPDLETIAKEYLKNLDLALNEDSEAKENYEWIILELFDQMVRSRSGGEMGDYLFQEKIPNEDYVYERIGFEGKQIRTSFLSKRKTPADINPVNFKEKNSFLKKYLLKIKGIKSKFKKEFKRRILSSDEVRALELGKFRKRGEIHQWMYDRYSLKKLLLETGFRDITVCSAFESKIPDWQKYQLDVTNGKVRKPDSLYIEALKI